jgi:hypothetical protein
LPGGANAGKTHFPNSRYITFIIIIISGFVIDSGFDCQRKFLEYFAHPGVRPLPTLISITLSSSE